MATNPYISKKVRSEQHLYEDIVIESLKFYGEDVYYLPREIVNKDKIFGDDIPSRFSDAYKIEMYIENQEGFDGEGDLFTKFGIELRDQATFVVARRRWKKMVGDNLAENGFRPREGDVIYLPMSESMFEVLKVETETPFYQLSNLPTFRMQCELFEYSDEDFDTDIASIDAVEYEGAFQYKVTMNTSDQNLPSLTPVLDDQGRISEVTVNSSGSGYTSAPVLNFPVISNQSVFGASSFHAFLGHGDERQYLLSSDIGTVELFFKVRNLPTSGQQALLYTGGNVLKSQQVIGVNQNGNVVYSYNDNDGQGQKELSGTSVSISGWNHFLFGVDNDSAGGDPKRVYAYLNGTELLDSVSPVSHDLINGTGYAVGGLAARIADSIEYGIFDGYIDEFRALAGNRATILDSRLDSNSELIVPTSPYDSDVNTAKINSADGTNAVLTAVLSNGGVGSVDIVNAGLHYTSVPTITIDAPTDGGQFVVGETVTQTNSEYTIKGEVTRWNDSDRILQLAHVGSTDGKYRTFTDTTPIVGVSSEAEWVPKLVEELQEIQQTAQNKIFDDFESDFLDFSESNPFGDLF